MYCWTNTALPFFPRPIDSLQTVVPQQRAPKSNNNNTHTHTSWTRDELTNALAAAGGADVDGGLAVGAGLAGGAARQRLVGANLAVEARQLLSSLTRVTVL